ncbi:hypothetical protein AAG570_007015 [Ranatra chinensis]|uniref:protein-tyrosine-phosphatase n=1 Tax=Ranatra chinensis TaxID=642074 RepID=A0ABD0ZCM1_9HEMI
MRLSQIILPDQELYCFPERKASSYDVQGTPCRLERLAGRPEDPRVGTTGGTFSGAAVVGSFLLVVLLLAVNSPAEGEDGRQLEKPRERQRGLAGNSYFNEQIWKMPVSPEVSTTTQLALSKLLEWKKKTLREEVSTTEEERNEPKKNATKKAKPSRPKPVTEDNTPKNNSGQDNEAEKSSSAFRSRFRDEEDGWRPSYHFPLTAGYSTTRRWPSTPTEFTSSTSSFLLSHIPSTSSAWSSLASMKAIPHHSRPTTNPPLSNPLSLYGKVKPFVPWSTRILKPTTEATPPSSTSGSVCRTDTLEKESLLELVEKGKKEKGNSVCRTEGSEANLDGNNHDPRTEDVKLIRGKTIAVDMAFLRPPFDHVRVQTRPAEILSLYRATSPAFRPTVKIGAKFFTEKGALSVGKPGKFGPNIHRIDVLHDDGSSTMTSIESDTLEITEKVKQLPKIGDTFLLKKNSTEQTKNDIPSFEQTGPDDTLNNIININNIPQATETVSFGQRNSANDGSRVITNDKRTNNKLSATEQTKSVSITEPTATVAKQRINMTESGSDLNTVSFSATSTVSNSLNPSPSSQSGNSFKFNTIVGVSNISTYDSFAKNIRKSVHIHADLKRASSSGQPEELMTSTIANRGETNTGSLVSSIDHSKNIIVDHANLNEAENVKMELQKETELSYSSNPSRINSNANSSTGISFIEEHTTNSFQIEASNTTLIRVTFVNESTSESIIPHKEALAGIASSSISPSSSLDPFNTTANLIGSNVEQLKVIPLSLKHSKITSAQQTIPSSSSLLPNDLTDSSNGTIANTIVPENFLAWKTEKRDTLLPENRNIERTSSISLLTTGTNVAQFGLGNSSILPTEENLNKETEHRKDETFQLNVSLTHGFDTIENPLSPTTEEPLQSVSDITGITPPTAQESEETLIPSNPVSDTSVKSSEAQDGATEPSLVSMPSNNISENGLVHPQLINESLPSLSSESTIIESHTNTNSSFSSKQRSESTSPALSTKNLNFSLAVKTSTYSSAPSLLFETYPPTKSREEKQYYKKKLSGFQGRHHKPPSLYGKIVTVFGDNETTPIYGSGGRIMTSQIRSQLQSPSLPGYTTTEFPTTESTSDSPPTGISTQEDSVSTVTYDATNIYETTMESNENSFGTSKSVFLSHSQNISGPQNSSIIFGTSETDLSNATMTGAPLSFSEILNGFTTEESRPTTISSSLYSFSEFSNKTEATDGNITSTVHGSQTDTSYLEHTIGTHRNQSASTNIDIETDTDRGGLKGIEKIEIATTIRSEEIARIVQNGTNRSTTEKTYTFDAPSQNNSEWSDVPTEPSKYITETTPPGGVFMKETFSSEDELMNRKSSTVTTNSGDTVFLTELLNNTLGIEKISGASEIAITSTSNEPLNHTEAFLEHSSAIFEMRNVSVSVNTPHSTNFTVDGIYNSSLFQNYATTSSSGSGSTEKLDHPEVIDESTSVPFSAGHLGGSVTVDVTSPTKYSQFYSSSMSTQETESATRADPTDKNDSSSTDFKLQLPERTSEATTSSDVPVVTPLSTSLPHSSIPPLSEKEIKQVKTAQNETQESSITLGKLNSTVALLILVDDDGSFLLVETTTTRSCRRTVFGVSTTETISFVISTLETTRDEDEDEGGVPNSGGGGEGVQYYDTLGPHPPQPRPHLAIRLVIRASYGELCKAKSDLRKSIIKAIRLIGDRAIDERQVVILNLPNEDCSIRQREEATPIDEDDSEIDDGEDEDGLDKKLSPVEIMLTDANGRYDSSLTDAFFELYQRRGTDTINFRYHIARVEKIVENDLSSDGESESDEIIKEETGVDVSIPSHGTMIAGIIVSSIAAVCLLFITILLIVVRRRQNGFSYGQRCTPVSLEDYSLDNISVYNSVRRKNQLRASKRSYGNPAFDDPVAISNVLNFAGLTNFANDRSKLDEEFSKIPIVTVKPDELPAGSESKNRYSNVIPIPETRVQLVSKNSSKDPIESYINANYVRVDREDEQRLGRVI